MTRHILIENETEIEEDHAPLAGDQEVVIVSARDPGQEIGPEKNHATRNQNVHAGILKVYFYSISS